MVEVNSSSAWSACTLAFPSATSCAAADSDGSGDFTIDEVVGAVGSTLNGCPSAASLVLSNAKVFTADPDRPAAEFVAICGERIVAVGAADDARGVADAETEVIDLQGRTRSIRASTTPTST